MYPNIKITPLCRMCWTELPEDSRMDGLCLQCKGRKIPYDTYTFILDQVRRLEEKVDKLIVSTQMSEVCDVIIDRKTEKYLRKRCKQITLEDVLFALGSITNESLRLSIAYQLLGTKGENIAQAIKGSKT